MLTVSGKALGRQKPLFADWSIPLPPEWSHEGGVTLRQIIEGIVHEQVAAFRKRQQDQQGLRVLTARQIAERAQRGKVTMGASDVAPQDVDVEAAVGAALQAYEDGLYLVVIDEEEQKSLDREVHLTEDSRVTFLRLALLAGG